MSDQTQSVGLFDLPEEARRQVESEPLTRGERRAQLVARRIAARIHPLGNLTLHADAATERDGDGLRCGTCRHRETLEHHNRKYPKCTYGNGIRVSGCESSDIRAWWPACRDYEAREEASGDASR